MKANLLLIGLLVASAGAFADEAYWTPGTAYTTAIDHSPWDDEKLSVLEYRILYLLAADLSSSRAAAALKDHHGAALMEVIRLESSLDEVMETLYAEAVQHFKARPHPYLLTMMLYHHDKYVNSAMERWGPTIKALRTVDEKATRHVQRLVEAGK